MQDKKNDTIIDKTPLLPAVVISALLFSLSFPSLISEKGIAPLAFISLIPIFLFIEKVCFKKAVQGGILFGAGLTVLQLFWFINVHMAAFIFMTVLMILMYGIFFGILNIVSKGVGYFRYLMYPLLWVLFDYLRTLGYIGFPWMFLGATQYEFTEFIQIASITGIWGVTFLVLSVNSIITFTCFLIGQKKNLKPLLLLIAAALIILIPCLYGNNVIHNSQNDVEKILNIAAIQTGDLTKRIEYDSRMQPLFDETEKAVSGKNIDIIILPEAAVLWPIPYHITKPEDFSRNTGYVHSFIEIQKTFDASMLIGTFDWIYSEDGYKRYIYNTNVFLNRDGKMTGKYYKTHLIPFVENSIDKNLSALIANIFGKRVFYREKGTEITIMDYEGYTFAAPICYDDLFPDFIRQFALKGANAFFVTVDDTILKSPVQVKQHFIHSLFRSVENNRPIVRSAKTGGTASIDRFGRVVKILPYMERGHIHVELPAGEKMPTTFYSTHGDWLPFACGILFIFTLGFIIVMKERNIISTNTYN